MWTHDDENRVCRLWLWKQQPPHDATNPCLHFKQTHIHMQERWEKKKKKKKGKEEEFCVVSRCICHKGIVADDLLRRSKDVPITHSGLSCILSVSLWMNFIFVPSTLHNLSLHGFTPRADREIDSGEVEEEFCLVTLRQRMKKKKMERGKVKQQSGLLSFIFHHLLSYRQKKHSQSGSRKFLRLLHHELWGSRKELIIGPDERMNW